MNDMIVKSVDLMGDTIMAAQDKNGNIWAGVNYFCNALGMSRGQKNRQVSNVQTDETLKQGCIKLGAGVLDAGNETIALRIDFVPLWLAKIVITDKTKQENPQLADKLLEYQLKAKDILAAAFLPKQDNSGDVQERIKLLAQGTTELYEKVDTLEQRFNKFEDELPVTGADMDDIQSAIRKKGIEVMGGRNTNAYQDNSTRGYVYADIQRELRRQFGVKRYKEIKHKDVETAVNIVRKYELPLVLKDRVDMENAQGKLDI